MSEEEIIQNVKRIIEHKVISNYINDNDSRAIQDLLDLYNIEKEKNKKLEDKIKMETNRLKEHGYWEFLEQRDLDKTISIIQNFLVE